MFIPNQNIRITQNKNTITATSLQNNSTPGIITRFNVKPNTDYIISYKGSSTNEIMLWIADQNKKMIHILKYNCLDNQNHKTIFNNKHHSIIYIGFLFHKGTILNKSFTIHHFHVSENKPLTIDTDKSTPALIQSIPLNPIPPNPIPPNPIPPKPIPLNPIPPKSIPPKSIPPNTNKVGIVVTTHGNNGILVRQCLNSLIDFISKYPIYIVLYINESEDPITLGLHELFPNIDVIYVNNQKRNGGLTGTWNQGIEKCIQQNCKVVILSNDDILVDNSIHHIIDDAMNCKSDLYFGPCSNCPCTKNLMRIYADGICLTSSNKRSRILTFNKRPFELNGFFLCFPTHVLVKNKFNARSYFNPQYPFAGNETEWFKRFFRKRGLGLLVYRTFVYHFKRASWHKKDLESDQICLYTVITSPFADYSLFHANTVSNCDCLCFSNQIHVLQHAIQLGWKPMYLGKNCKDRIKMIPNEYLPNCYKTSIYIETPDKIPFQNAQHFLNDCKIDKIYTPSHKIVPKIDKELLDIITNGNFSIPDQLSDTSLIVRKHKELVEFGKDWFTMYSKYKNQIVFDYLVWKYKSC